MLYVSDDLGPESRIMWKLLTPSQQQSTRTILILALITCCWRACGAKPKRDFCVLNDQQYRVGETWHPKIPPVEEYCVNCSCLAGGKVKCTSVDCAKPDCDYPAYLPGECCPVCNEIPNIPPTVEDKVDKPELLPVPGCDHDGEKYEDGELFPSNRTSFKPLHDNQCVLCACYKGGVFCHLKTCIPQPGCLRTVRVSDDCCPQCEEFLEEKTSVTSKEEPLEPGACLSTMGPQRNGSTWKPVVGQYGEMECVLCKCQNGRVDCSRVQCPAESVLKCKRPQLRKGKCCRECPNGRRKGGRRGKGKKKKKKNGKRCKKDKDGQKRSKKGKKKRKRCRRNNKKKQTKLTPNTAVGNTRGNGFHGNMTMTLAKPKLCVHTRADYLVYITKGDNSYSIILDNTKNDSMENTYWLLRRGRIVSIQKTSVVDTSKVRSQMTIGHLMGVTTKRNFQKFLQRWQRKHRKCKKKCRRKHLDRIIKKLKVKKVNLKKSC